MEQILVRREGHALAEHRGNYTYDDSKVLVAPNGSIRRLRRAIGFFSGRCTSANLIANAHFLRMNWNITSDAGPIAILSAHS